MVRRAYAYSRPGSRLHLHNSDLGVVLIDIDNLHRINETHGDEVGDEVLIQLGAMLGRKVRQHDSVVRWDGDTFMALLRQVNRSGMRDVVERLQQWIREESFTGSGGQRFAITCSSGYCHYPLGELGHFSWEDIVKVADAGLRLGRQAGGDVAIGVSEGPEPIDTTGAPLVVEDLAQAAEKGYVRLLWERQPGEDESTVDS
jgi:diguanylate cyclase (GGDEF)-like protein